ncbi:MAG: EAL domain-containing protein [Pseudomonadota bacterium]
MLSASRYQTGPWVRRLFRLADEWSRLPAGASHEERVRARAVALLSGAFALVGSTLILISVVSAQSATLEVVIAWIGIAGMAISPFVLRATRAAQPAGAIFAGSIILALAVWPLLEGGLYAPDNYILAATPLVICLLVNVRVGLVYTLVLALYFPFLLALHPDSSDRVVTSDLYYCAILITTALLTGFCTAGYGLMANHVLARFETEQRAASEHAAAAEQSLRRLREFTDIASDLLWEVDMQGRLLFVGGRMLKDKLKRPVGEILGKPYTKLLRFRAADGADLGRALKREEAYSDIPAVFVDDDGQEYIFSLSGTPKFDEAGAVAGFIGVGRDVTERVSAQHQIRFLAECDMLTGLANRHAFTTRIEQDVQNTDDERGLAVFAIDLDSFKTVNDSYGHDVGDKLLVEVANRLKGAIRTNDWAARLGGDEFMVVSHGHSHDGASATAAAERLLQTLCEPYRIDELELMVQASVGVACAPLHASSAQELIKCADLALYSAKSAGRSKWMMFAPAMREVSARRKRLETGLRRALEDGGLSVAYQPLLDLRTGALSGFEALARWEDPDLGVIRPDVFIEVAEHCGLIRPLGEHVMRLACAEAAAWPDAADLRIAVNISAVQFADRSLPDTIRSCLDDTGLAPQRLELEITESHLVADVDSAVKTLTALEALGVGIAIDDFGTGYSSLSRLRLLPLNRLKIDRSFISEIARNENSRTITQAIIQLADNLGVSVVAEGIETERQKSWLTDAGCAEGQGYLFAKPMAPDQARAFVAARGGAPDRAGRKTA